MDVRQLEYFVAVAEELNFTRAAARCHVVQSALSYQIARLEREHGVTLFERTSRSVRLAPAGELLLPRARRVLAELDAGRRRAGRAGRRGHRPAAARHDRQRRPGRAARWSGRWPTFHHRHPGVEIAIRTPGAGTWPSRCAPASWTSRSSACSPTSCRPTSCTACSPTSRWSPSSPAATRWPAAPADLAELAADSPFVEMRAESGLRHQVDAAFARAGVARRIAFELGTSDAVVRFVGLGFGPAVVPRSAAAARPQRRHRAPARRPGRAAPDRPGAPPPRAAAPAARALLPSSARHRPDHLVGPMQDDWGGVADRRRNRSGAQMDAMAQAATPPLVGLTSVGGGGPPPARRGERGGVRGLAQLRDDPAHQRLLLLQLDPVRHRGRAARARPLQRRADQRRARACSTR